jgi:PEP-CTERM motif-containing protein
LPASSHTHTASNPVAMVSLYSGVFGDAHSKMPVFSFLTSKFGTSATPGLLVDKPAAAVTPFQVIPLPSTLWLFGLGLIGVAAMARRRP